MNITIVHTLSPEVIELFKGFLTGATPAPKTEGKGKSKQPLTSVPATQKEEIPADEPKTENSNDASDEEINDALSLETVRELVNSKAQSGEAQKAKVKKLLGEFGADKLTALDAKHYTDFYKKLKLIA